MSVFHKFGRDVRAHRWDYGSAGAMVVVAIVALISRIDVQDVDAHRFHADTVWSWAVTIAVCAGLAGRRRWPLRSLAVGLLLVVPLEVAKHRDTVVFFAMVIALYSVAACHPRRLAWRALAMIGALYAVLIGNETIIISAAPLLGPLFLAAGYALGRIVRLGRARQEREVEAAVERAARLREVAALGATRERLRMAQELHDVVAHSLSVIAVQAGIGAHLTTMSTSASTTMDTVRRRRPMPRATRVGTV